MVVYSFAHATMVFSRGTLIIHPTADMMKDSQNPSAAPRPTVRFTEPIQLEVEIRNTTSFQSRSTHYGETLQGNDAHLIILPDLKKTKEETKVRVSDTPYPIPTAKPPPPSKNLAPLLTTQKALRHRIEPANVYAPIDMIAIDKMGKILEIWPNIILANIASPILLPIESYAVLYLAGNRAGQLGILPNDRVENELFAKPTMSLQSSHEPERTDTHRLKLDELSPLAPEPDY